MLGHDDLGGVLVGAVGVVLVVAVQEHHHIRVLLDRVVGDHTVGHEVVGADDGGVVCLGVAHRGDRHDLVPHHLGVGQLLQPFAVEHAGDPREPGAAGRPRARLGAQQVPPAVLLAQRRCQIPLGHARSRQLEHDRVADLGGNSVHVGIAPHTLECLQRLGDQLSPFTRKADPFQESALLVDPVHPEPVAGCRRTDVVDPTQHSEAQQESLELVDERPRARRGCDTHVRSPAQAGAREVADATEEFGQELTERRVRECADPRREPSLGYR